MREGTDYHGGRLTDHIFGLSEEHKRIKPFAAVWCSYGRCGWQVKSNTAGTFILPAAYLYNYQSTRAGFRSLFYRQFRKRPTIFRLIYASKLQVSILPKLFRHWRRCPKGQIRVQMRTYRYRQLLEGQKWIHMTRRVLIPSLSWPKGRE